MVILLNNVGNYLKLASILPFAELQSDRSAPADRPCSSQGRNSDAGDGDRMRVADIIKRLTGANHSQISNSSSWSDDNEQHTEHSSVTGSPNRGFLDQTEHQKVFSQLTCIPRVRGRQAFADLLIRLERDRLAELDSLVERKAVSRFSQRGRIQVKQSCINDPQIDFTLHVITYQIETNITTHFFYCVLKLCSLCFDLEYCNEVSHFWISNGHNQQRLK